VIPRSGVRKPPLSIGDEFFDILTQARL